MPSMCSRRCRALPAVLNMWQRGRAAQDLPDSAPCRCCVSVVPDAVGAPRRGTYPSDMKPNDVKDVKLDSERMS